MGCSGQCTTVHWRAVGVAKLSLKLVKGSRPQCELSNESAAGYLRLDAIHRLNTDETTKVRSCDCDFPACDCGLENGKKEVVLTKVYPHSVSYVQTTVTKVGGELFAELVCEWEISGDVTLEKIRTTGECSPFKIPERPKKKYYMVRSGDQEALVTVPPGDDWAAAIRVALAPRASAGATKGRTRRHR